MIWNLLRRRRLRRRGLFCYHDGRKTRWADPMAVWRHLCNHSQVNMDTVADTVDAREEPETTNFLTALCEAFGVQRFDSETTSGLRDGELFDLFYALSDHFSALKKNSSPGPILSPPTESESSIFPEPPVAAASS